MKLGFFGASATKAIVRQNYDKRNRKDRLITKSALVKQQKNLETVYKANILQKLINLCMWYERFFPKQKHQMKWYMLMIKQCKIFVTFTHILGRLKEYVE